MIINLVAMIISEATTTATTIKNLNKKQIVAHYDVKVLLQQGLLRHPPLKGRNIYLHIPLPDDEARKTLLKHTGTGENNGDNNFNENKEGNAFNLTDEELNELVAITNGYSCSDIVSLCREASFGPLRDLGDDIMTAKATDMRPINYDDFINAKNVVYSSVSADAVDIFVQFNKEYGGGGV